MSDTTKRIDPEDPRLTSYVLGELAGEERKAFEAELAADPTAQKEVTALRATTTLLANELALEPAPELKPEQRRKLTSRAPPPMPPPTSWFSTGFRVAAFAGVCGVIMIPVVGMFTMGKADSAFYKSIEYSRGPAPMGMPRGSVGAPGPRGYDLAMVRPAPQQHAQQEAKYRAQLAPTAPKALPPPPPPAKSDGDRRAVDPRAMGGAFADLADSSMAGYDRTIENDFKTAAGEPLSTFSIDVDTASYAVVRRFLTQHSRPPVDAVRIEELVNYFPYEYPEPDAGEPLTVMSETTACPWKPGNRLVRLGLKGRSLKAESRPNSNLVFLIDVSGSMNPPDRLPLCLDSLRLLVPQLDERDSIAIVVYAGAAGVVLPPTSGSDKATILAALDKLHAGGSTNGGQGIQLAYDLAVGSFIKGGNNRVIIATDGDFNVGVRSRGDLERMIEEKRQSGVFLSVLGYGMGNHQDGTLESLSRRGNGNYAYIDTLREARKVLVEQMGGTLVAVAKDVKVQVEFNPTQVKSYRLIGYENRILAAQDFNDDKKDAGELGAGHTVTALYEIVPVASEAAPAGSVDPLKYQQVAPAAGVGSRELLTVKVRHQKPEGSASTLLSFPVTDRGAGFDAASVDTRFAAAVAAFGMILRNSQHHGTATLEQVATIAAGARGKDEGGYRAEFLELVTKARAVVR